MNDHRTGPEAFAPPFQIPERLKGSALEYFLIVFALSVPFWVLGSRPLPLPMNLPISSLQWLLPLPVAAVLLLRREGRRGVRRLLQRVLDYRKIRPRVWYLPIVFGPPAILLLTYVVMRSLGMQLPEPRVAVALIPALLAGFFLAGIFEETGWMGYAFDRMPARWNALTAAVVLGLVHSTWHVVPNIEQGHPAPWIAWKILETTSIMILTVWLYNNTNGSVFSAIVSHATYNVAWVLFPNDGSYYDPAIGGILFAIAAAAVTFLWGPSTLARYRYAGHAEPDETWPCSRSRTRRD